MCLTLPAKIISFNGKSAYILTNGKGQKVKIGFSKPIRAGDWILVNADLAVAKINSKEAKEINNYFKK